MSLGLLLWVITIGICLIAPLVFLATIALACWSQWRSLAVRSAACGLSVGGFLALAVWLQTAVTSPAERTDWSALGIVFGAGYTIGTLVYLTRLLLKRDAA